MIKNPKFKLGEEVYLKTGSNRESRIITRISLYPGGRQYELSCGTETSWHYGFELTKESIGKIPKVKGMGK
jgi:hypothetical protein